MIALLLALGLIFTFVTLLLLAVTAVLVLIQLLREFL